MKYDQIINFLYENKRNQLASPNTIDIIVQIAKKQWQLIDHHKRMHLAFSLSFYGEYEIF
jgi:hypothetical protein